MDTTFDINKVREETLQGPATWGQCNKLGRIWSENNGKKNYRLQSQITATLYDEAKNGKLKFIQAHALIEKKKTCPKKYKDKINAFLSSRDA